MTMNRAKVKLPSSNRQRITLIITVIVIGIVLWQILSLFGIGAGSNNKSATEELSAGTGTMTKMPAPAPAILDKSTATTEREKALIELQERTQAAYLKALNELQMLKIQRDIANTNREIATARLDTVTAQKKIIDAITPPAAPPTPAAITRSAETPVSGGGDGDGNYTQAITYNVVSISKLKNKWRAVVSGKNNLYNVEVGDVLPDKTKIVKIDDASVTIDKPKEGEIKLTLVPVL